MESPATGEAAIGRQKVSSTLKRETRGALFASADPTAHVVVKSRTDPGDVVVSVCTPG